MFLFQTFKGAPHAGIDISKGVSAAFAPAIKEYNELTNRITNEVKRLKNEIEPLRKQNKAPLEKLGNELLDLRNKLATSAIDDQPQEAAKIAEQYKAKFEEYKKFAEGNFAGIAKFSEIENRLRSASIYNYAYKPESPADYQSTTGEFKQVLDGLKKCKPALEAIDRLANGTTTIKTEFSSTGYDGQPGVQTIAKSPIGTIEIDYSYGEASGTFKPKKLDLKQKIKKNE